MDNTIEWWKMIFRLHAEILENYNECTFCEFKQQILTIPYKYADTSVLGVGAVFVNSIAHMFNDAAHLSYERDRYEEAESFMEHALDYYCDPMLEFDDDLIDESKAFMREIVSHRKDYVYDGLHNIYDE